LVYSLSGKNQFGYRLLVIGYQKKTKKTRAPKGGTTSLVPTFCPLKLAKERKKNCRAGMVENLPCHVHLRIDKQRDAKRG